VQPRAEGGSGSDRYRPADDNQHDRYDGDRDGRRTTGNEHRDDLDVDEHDIHLHVSDNGINRNLLTGATLEVRQRSQEEPSMKQTFTLIASLTLSVALVGCSTTRTADTTVTSTTNTSMASSSSTTDVVTTPVATNYGGTAATTGTTATYGTGESNFNTGVQSATTNPTPNYGIPSTDINSAATTDTTANVGMASSSSPATSTTATDSGTTSSAGRHHRHRAMHKE